MGDAVNVMEPAVIVVIQAITLNGTGCKLIELALNVMEMIMNSTKLVVNVVVQLATCHGT